MNPLPILHQLQSKITDLLEDARKKKADTKRSSTTRHAFFDGKTLGLREVERELGFLLHKANVDQIREESSVSNLISSGNESGNETGNQSILLPQIFSELLDTLVMALPYVEENLADTAETCDSGEAERVLRIIRTVIDTSSHFRDKWKQTVSSGNNTGNILS